MGIHVDLLSFDDSNKDLVKGLYMKYTKHNPETLKGFSYTQNYIFKFSYFDKGTGEFCEKYYNSPMIRASICIPNNEYESFIQKYDLKKPDLYLSGMKYQYNNPWIIGEIKDWIVLKDNKKDELKKINDYISYLESKGYIVMKK